MEYGKMKPKNISLYVDLEKTIGEITPRLSICLSLPNCYKLLATCAGFQYKQKYHILKDCFLAHDTA